MLNFSNLGIPPTFGTPEARKLFLFDPEYHPTNHGSYGAIPAEISSQQKLLQSRMESNPDLWMKCDVQSMMENALQHVAPLLNISPHDIVFVSNATGGVNAVVRSMRNLLRSKGFSNVLENGRRRSIIHFSTLYGAVRNTIEYIADVTDMTTIDVPLTYPMSDDDVVETFEKAIQIELSLGGKIFMAVFDVITSMPGVLVPYKRLTEICHKYSILSMVDGAHAIGQVPLNLQDCEPDFFTTNLHKWLYTPRGTAILYVKKEYQHFVEPNIVSFGYSKIPQDHKNGGRSYFKENFMYSGTKDESGFICSKFAAQYRVWLGGEEKINEYNQQLINLSSLKIAEILGTETMHSKPVTISMAMVKIPNTAGWEDQHILKLQIYLLKYKKYAVPFVKHGDCWWLRVSAQIYNNFQEYQDLGELLKLILNNSPPPEL